MERSNDAQETLNSISSGQNTEMMRVGVKKYYVNRKNHDMILPSKNASSEMWNSNRSLVESVTLSTRMNSFGNGF